MADKLTTTRSVGRSIDDASILTVPIALGWLGVKLARDLLPPLLPAISKDLSLSTIEGGVALTALGICYAMLQYPGGRLSDQLSRKTLLVGSLLIATVGAGLLAMTGSYLGLLLGVTVLGIGTGLYSIPWRALLSDLYTDRRGRAFGAVQAAGRLGSALTAVVVLAAFALGPWTVAFVPVAIGLFGVAVLYHRLASGHYVLRPVSLGVRDTGSRLFSSAAFRRLTLAYITFAFAWQGVGRFLPMYLQLDKGFTPAAASSGFAGLFLVGIVISPLAGGLSDRGRRGLLAAAILGIGATGVATLIVPSSVPIIVLGIGLFAVGMMGFPPVMQAYLMDLFPADSRGGDLGATKTVYSGIGNLSPAYVGLVAELADFTIAFASLAGVLVVGTGLLLWHTVVTET